VLFGRISEPFFDFFFCFLLNFVHKESRILIAWTALEEDYIFLPGLGAKTGLAVCINEFDREK
jgi:hypothetical protein